MYPRVCSGVQLVFVKLNNPAGGQKTNNEKQHRGKESQSNKSINQLPENQSTTVLNII